MKGKTSRYRIGQKSLYDGTYDERLMSIVHIVCYLDGHENDQRAFERVYDNIAKMPSRYMGMMRDRVIRRIRERQLQWPMCYRKGGGFDPDVLEKVSLDGVEYLGYPNKRMYGKKLYFIELDAGHLVMAHERMGLIIMN